MLAHSRRNGHAPLDQACTREEAALLTLSQGGGATLGRVSAGQFDGGNERGLDERRASNQDSQVRSSGMHESLRKVFAPEGPPEDAYW